MIGVQMVGVQMEWGLGEWGTGGWDWGVGTGGGRLGETARAMGLVDGISNSCNTQSRHEARE